LIGGSSPVCFTPSPRAGPVRPTRRACGVRSIRNRSRLFRFSAFQFSALRVAGLYFAGDYNLRGRTLEADVDVCFNGNIAVSQVKLI
jgi:hypothetical protein